MKMSVGQERVGEPAGYSAWPVGVRTLVVRSVHQVSTHLLTLSSSSLCCPFSHSPSSLSLSLSLSLPSSPSFLSLGSLLFFVSLFLFIPPSLASFQFSFVRYARSVHLLYDGRTCILRGPPQKEVALKGKARLIR